MLDHPQNLVGLSIFLIYIVGLAAVEFALIRSRGQTYPWKDVLASLGVAAGRRVVLVLGGGVVAKFILMHGHSHRLSDIVIDDFSLRSLGLALCLFLLIDFLYYWHHRMMHQVRFFWADHAVHHSPNKLVLPVAERIGWFGALSGLAMFYLPAVLVGFSPKAVLIALSINLLYQYWVHTELVGDLGWFEKVFNTPSHHRVHHASNPRYLDSNYGGVLIIFDRIFGTFTPFDPSDTITYGLVRPLESHNPFKIATHEWISMLKDVFTHLKSPKTAAMYLLARPGWSHDGSRQTSAQLKASSKSESPSGKGASGQFFGHKKPISTLYS